MIIFIAGMIAGILLSFGSAYFALKAAVFAITDGRHILAKEMAKEFNKRYKGKSDGRNV